MLFDRGILEKQQQQNHAIRNSIASFLGFQAVVVLGVPQ
jgi:hypothetical protein